MATTNARYQIIIVTALIVVLYFALAYGIYIGVTQHVLGANDFYSRWMGARALFLRGENPYSDAVTREIQLGMYGWLARPDEDQVAFAYPLYAAFVVAPFVVLPYAQAQALWMAFLIFAVAGGALALAQWYRISLQPAALVALLIGSLMFYPALRGIFNGQFALVSFFCLALSLWLIEANRDVSAGVLLALATVKPQPAVFLVPIVIAWAAWQRRSRIVVSAIGVLTALLVIALLLVPTWLFDFVTALQKYTQYERVGPPVQTLSEWLVPSAWFPVTVVVSLILIAWMVWRVVCTPNQPWENFQPTIGLAALVTTLTAGRVGTPDQVLLLIPWLAWIAQLLKRGQIVRVGVAVLVLLLLPWSIFFATLRGDTEHVVVTLVLPLLTLALFLWQRIGAHTSVEESH